MLNPIHEYLFGGVFEFSEGQAVRVIAAGEEHERGVVARMVHRPGGGEDVYWVQMSHGAEWRYYGHELIDASPEYLDAREPHVYYCPGSATGWSECLAGSQHSSGQCKLAIVAPIHDTSSNSGGAS